MDSIEQARPDPVAIQTTPPLFAAPRIRDELAGERDRAAALLKQLQGEHAEAQAVYERTAADLEAVLKACELALEELERSPGLDQKISAGKITGEAIAGGRIVERGEQVGG